VAGFTTWYIVTAASIAITSQYPLHASGVHSGEAPGPYSAVFTNLLACQASSFTRCWASR
jgi:hypothetical protein